MPRRNHIRRSHLLRFRHWFQGADGDLRSTVFWTVLFVGSLLRLLLSSDLTPLIRNGRHDEMLYATRAFFLVSGEAFGSYTPQMLLKLPGFSFVLAAIHALGIGYWDFLNLFLCIAGGYLAWAISASGGLRWTAIAAFLAFVFCPVTLSYSWQTLARENFTLCLAAFIFGSAIVFLNRLREGGFSSVHALVFAVSVALSVLTREEDRLFFAFILILVGVLYFDSLSQKPRHVFRFWVRGVVFLALPLLMVRVGERLEKKFVRAKYGRAITSELTEGEFPGFVAALRSVNPSAENRFVMVSQAALKEIAKEVPRLAPITARLLPLASRENCGEGVACTEVLNPELITAAIQEAVFDAGFAPSLEKAQDFYRVSSTEIHEACRRGKLSCTERGEGLFPPLSLAWIRPLVHGTLNSARKTVSPAIRPENDLHPSEDERDPLKVSRFTAVTNPKLFREVAVATRPMEKQAPAGGIRSQIRSSWNAIYQFAGPFILAFACLITLLQLLLWFPFRRMKPAPLPLVLTSVVLGYLLVRALALSYFTVWMGYHQDRLFYPSYAILMAVASFFALESLLRLLEKSIDSAKAKGYLDDDKPYYLLTPKFRKQKKRHQTPSGRALLLFALLLGALQTAEASGIQIEIDVDKRLSRHSELFQNPALLGLALEASGSKISYSGRLEISSKGLVLTRRNPFPFERAEVRFQSREKDLLKYSIITTLQAGGLRKDASLPVTADISRLEQGKILVYVSLPAFLAPTSLLDKVESKLAAQFGPDSQSRLVSFLDEVHPTGNSVESSFRETLVRTYNQTDFTPERTVADWEPGRPEPVSDLFLLLATIAIWFAAGPLVLYWLNRRLARR